MDYSNWPQIQQYPNPNPEYSLLQTPNQPVPYPQNLQIPNQSVAYPQNLVSDGALFVPRPAPAAVNYAHQPFIFQAQPAGDAAASVAAASYYPDPNLSWVSPTQQFGTTPYTSGVNATNVEIQPETIHLYRRNLPGQKGCAVCLV